MTIDDDYKLPCDVFLTPSTRIGKGCPMSTLLTALGVEGRPSGDEFRLVRRKSAEDVPHLREELQQAKDALSTINNPDQLLCCNGHDCGCQGATVGQYAAWLMKQ